MILGHGGNIFDLAKRLGCAPFDILDMSSNVNPLGPPPGLLEHLKSRMEAVTALPEVNAATPAAVFASQHGIDASQVIAGAGTTQFIYALPKVLEMKRALILGPTYADYADACALHGVAVNWVLATDDASFAPDIPAVERGLSDVDSVFICNPNNPTGALIPPEKIEALAAAHPSVRFLVDESYLPFLANAESLSLVGRTRANLFVLSSFSKIFKVPGLRIGFLTAEPSVIEKVAPYVLPWSVSSLAQEAVLWLSERSGDTDAHVRKTCAYVAGEADRIVARISDIDGLTPFPAKVPFIVVRLDGGPPSREIWKALSDRKILIRDCANFKGLSDRFIRISLKGEDANRQVTEHLAELVRGRSEA